MDYRCVFLAQIPEEGLAINNRFDACDLFDDEDGVQVAEAIHFKGMIREVSHRYLLSGRITTRLNLVCDRCLKEIQYPVDQGIIVHFAVRSDTARTAERADSETAEDPEDIIDDRIDICRVIAEQIVLQIPMKTLCSDDCKGLCSRCGADLNAGTCGCDRDSVDPRLAKLKDLLEK